MDALPVQRWRVAYRRLDGARVRPYRDAVDGIESALLASDLPLARRTERGERARVEFAPPLPVGVVADEELLDLYLVERWPRQRVRDRLEAALGDEIELLELHDVWLRASGLAASVVAADYVATLDIASGDAYTSVTAIGDGAAVLLAADRLPRERDRGGRITGYDLRALIDELRVTAADPIDGLAIPVLQVSMRLRIDANLGYGRPEEVLAALGEIVGQDLQLREPIVRGRVHLSHG